MKREPKISHMDKMLGKLQGFEQLDQEALKTAALAQGVHTVNNSQQMQNLDQLGDVGKALTYSGQDSGNEILEYVAQQYGFKPDQSRQLAKKAAAEGMTIEQYQEILGRLQGNQQLAK